MSLCRNGNYVFLLCWCFSAKKTVLTFYCCCWSCSELLFCSVFLDRLVLFWFLTMTFTWFPNMSLSVETFWTKPQVHLGSCSTIQCISSPSSSYCVLSNWNKVDFFPFSFLAPDFEDLFANFSTVIFFYVHVLFFADGRLVLRFHVADTVFAAVQ